MFFFRRYRNCCQCRCRCCCRRCQRPCRPEIETVTCTMRVIDIPTTVVPGPGSAEPECCDRLVDALQDIRDTLSGGNCPSSCGSCRRCR